MLIHLASAFKRVKKKTTHLRTILHYRAPEVQWKNIFIRSSISSGETDNDSRKQQIRVHVKSPLTSLFKLNKDSRGFLKASETVFE